LGIDIFLNWTVRKIERKGDLGDSGLCLDIGAKIHAPVAPTFLPSQAAFPQPLAI